MKEPDLDATGELELALARYLADERISRRDLLARVAKVGAAAALAPIAAACTSAATAAPATPTSGPTAAGAVPTPVATATPTPLPSPEGQLYIYNWQDYMGTDVVSSFEKKYGVKVTQDFFPDYQTMEAKVGAGGSGYDITFPTSVDIPKWVTRGLLVPLDQSLIPNRANLGPAWQNPGYDPGNKYSMPYMWWTTGVAYDTSKIKEELTSWKALWDPRWKGHISVLDDYREAFGMALIRLGYSVNTTSDKELDAALALLEQQKPLVRTYTVDDIGELSSGDSWVVHAWGSDVHQVLPERPTVKFYTPEEGGIRGSDTMAIISGTKHPIAANLFINYMLDAKISAANTNKIGYMGPNQAAIPYIDPNILSDPAVNPADAVVAKLQELLDLGPDLQKYNDRWLKLRSGA